MNDMMTFPDTWEEFEKSYGFTDNEEVYTNGARLIPSFRVKQWLDHLPSAQPRRGKWAGKGDSEEFGIFICDNCGKFAMMEYDFCPNCGAELRPQFEEPEINPCRGCEDYDGKGGCKTKGGCADRRGDSGD